MMSRMVVNRLLIIDIFLKEILVSCKLFTLGRLAGCKWSLVDKLAD